MTSDLCDLHMHTHYSDGRATPEELLRHAAGLGLAAIAITDHENARGSREARPLAAELGLELIPALEMTCRWDGYGEPDGCADIDMLAYFVDLDDQAFQTFEQALLADLNERFADCCARLTAAGYPLTLDDAFVENPRYVGLIQLSRTLRRLGYLEPDQSSVGLLRPYYRQVRPSRFSIDQIIAAVHAAGGVVVLAHPVLVTHGGEWLRPRDVAALVEMGLDGIEVYHPRLDPNASAYFLDLAQQFDLATSGGSDEHGWPEGLKRLGTLPVTMEMLEGLRARRP